MDRPFGDFGQLSTPGSLHASRLYVTFGTWFTWKCHQIRGNDNRLRGNDLEFREYEHTFGAAYSCTYT